MIRRITPRFRGYPGQTIRIVRGPIPRLVRSPAVVDARAPAITVTTQLLPVAIVVQVIYSGNVVSYVLIAGESTRRIIVERIVQVGIVAIVATVIQARVAIAIVAIHHRPRRARV